MNGEKRRISKRRLVLYAPFLGLTLTVLGVYAVVTLADGGARLLLKRLSMV
ncbi:hypothetical protein KKC88_02880 [Patescibacteria group bacterium]|nr:hypothetical protein [Patescibacteria group bacterium]MBU1673816.1 hypothetical protein [Patescibacteria group bacterium]MBU1964063.1 hypothetical protein [Patescibacteria group bacterium]